MRLHALSLLVGAALCVAGAAAAQSRGEIKPLPREFRTLYDCRGEVALVSYYWDRLPQRPGGGKPDPAVLAPLMRAFQAGNIEECHRRVIEVRRYLGLL